MNNISLHVKLLQTFDSLLSSRKGDSSALSANNALSLSYEIYIRCFQIFRDLHKCVLNIEEAPQEYERRESIFEFRSLWPFKSTFVIIISKSKSWFEKTVEQTTNIFSSHTNKNCWKSYQVEKLLYAVYISSFSSFFPAVHSSIFCVPVYTHWNVSLWHFIFFSLPHFFIESKRDWSNWNINSVAV